jgi:uncharacterized membrane protein YqiK
MLHYITFVKPQVFIGPSNDGRRHGRGTYLLDIRNTFLCCKVENTIEERHFNYFRNMTDFKELQSKLCKSGERLVRLRPAKKAVNLEQKWFVPQEEESKPDSVEAQIEAEKGKEVENKSQDVKAKAEDRSKDAEAEVKSQDSEAEDKIQVAEAEAKSQDSKAEAKSKDAEAEAKSQDSEAEAKSKDAEAEVSAPEEADKEAGTKAATADAASTATEPGTSLVKPGA